MSKKVYLLSRKDCLIGVFSNKKLLTEAFLEVNTDCCYIDGVRPLKVTYSSLYTYLSRKGFLKIYSFDTKEPLYRIWEVTINNIHKPKIYYE